MLTARFTDRSTGNPLTVRYQFRDDPISPSPNTTHTYYQPGTSTVSLTVWGTGDLKPVSNITLLQNLIVVT